MFDYSSNGITLSLVRDVRNKKDQKGPCPIRWRVTYQRKQVYYSTGIVLNDDEWNELQDKKNKRTKKHLNELQNYFDKTIQKHIKDLAETGTFSFEKLNIRLNKAVITSVNNAFESKINDLKNANRIGNANIYVCTLNSIESFAGKNISFTSITPKWLCNYQTFMEEKRMKYTSIGMYMRTLRAIVNDAIVQEFMRISDYPFGKEKENKYKIPTGSGREMALTLEDIKNIESFKCANQTIERCRDLWIFSFYCNGANFGDMLRFTYDCIDNDEIYFFRKKTINTSSEKKEIIAPILPPMKSIIERWGNKDKKKTNYIFPFLSDCKTEAEIKHEIHNVIRLTNKTIKIVTEELKLPNISTYNARHSYSTILAKKRVPESFISEQLGHSDKNVTQGYFGRYSKKERLTYNSMLLWNLKNGKSSKKMV